MRGSELDEVITLSLSTQVAPYPLPANMVIILDVYVFATVCIRQVIVFLKKNNSLRCSWTCPFETLVKSEI